MKNNFLLINYIIQTNQKSKNWNAILLINKIKKYFFFKICVEIKIILIKVILYIV